jgi:putative FmdB family regulatory protein
MPIYPYVCTACGHEFDALQKISDDPLKDCPECGESSLRKRLAAPAFQLKGTGWYETDFKNSGKGKETAGKGNGEDKSAGDKAKSGSGSKSDSKAQSGSGDKGSSASGSKAAAAKED